MPRNSDGRKTRLGLGSDSGSNRQAANLFSGANRRFVAYSQLVAAFRAPASQHGPAIRRLHTHAKAVSFSPLAIIRLKSTFWHYNSFRVIFGDGYGQPGAANMSAGTLFR
jgi:hypothetical protein